jgi:hypothetical protein
MYRGSVAEKLFPYKHRTLGAIRNAGLHLHAFCLNPGCGWDADLDIGTLIERLGRQHSAMQPDLVPLLVCSRCGGKDIAVVLSATEEVPTETAEHVRQDWKRPRDTST